MIIVYDILQRLWPDVPAADEVTLLLPKAGVEVESAEVWHYPAGDSQVVVGKIVAIEAHPNADKLQVTQMMVKAGGQPVQIICGAKNIAVGQLVPVVLPGSTLPNGLTIEAREIRGVRSEGMLASSDELGLGRGEDGILILDGLSDSEIGRPLADLWPSTMIYDLTLTPNRGDLLSHWGIVRDLQAMTGHQASDYPIDFFGQAPIASEPTGSYRVEVKASADCLIFTLREIQLPKAARSPFWLKRDLLLLQQSIHSLAVDATNYITLLFGQPSHVYDADLIVGRTLYVQRQNDDENITLLDDSSVILCSNDLVIGDEIGPVALAGVMGGARTAVRPESTHLLLEVADWHYGTIRAMRRRHHLSTEASYRYERRVDTALAPIASLLLSQLLQREAGAEMLGYAVVDQRVEQAQISYSAERFERHLGVNLPVEKQAELLQLSGSRVQLREADRLEVLPPSWRLDLAIQEDLEEEVARLYGLDNVHQGELTSVGEPSALLHDVQQRELLRDWLAEQGLNEVISSPFTAQQMFQPFGLATEEMWRVTNPASPEMTWLRVSLLPGLVGALVKNQFERDHLGLFEIGHVASRGERGLIEHVREEERLAVVLMTDAAGELVQLVSECFERLGISVQRREEEPTALMAGRLVMTFDGQTVGELLVPGKTWLNQLKLKRPIVFMELRLDRLLPASQQVGQPITPKHLPVYQPFSRFPKVERDVTFLLADNDDSFFEEVVLPLVGDGLLKEVEYKSAVVGNELRATVTFKFVSPDRTLSKEEVEEDLESKVAVIENTGRAKRQRSRI